MSLKLFCKFDKYMLIHLYIEERILACVLFAPIRIELHIVGRVTNVLPISYIHLYNLKEADTIMQQI